MTKKIYKIRDKTTGLYFNNTSFNTKTTKTGRRWLRYKAARDYLSMLLFAEPPHSPYHNQFEIVEFTMVETAILPIQITKKDAIN